MQLLKCNDYPFYQFINQRLNQLEQRIADHGNYLDNRHPLVRTYQQLKTEIKAFQKRIELLNQYIQQIGPALVDFKITGDGCGTYIEIKTPFFIDQNGILDLSRLVNQQDTYYYNNRRLIHKSIVDLSDVPTSITMRFGETPSRFKICNYYPFAQLLSMSGNPIEHLYPDSENYVEFEPCDFGIVSHY